MIPRIYAAGTKSLVRLVLLLSSGLALLASLLTAPVLAQGAQPSAQATPVLATLDVSLLPEYDRPEMLVIYQGQFAADTPLPLTVQIRIPSEAGQPSAVAYRSEAGELLSLDYSTLADGEWLVVAFELPTLRFQVEYYAPIEASGGQKSYVFAYSGGYPVDAFNLDVQVPPTSQGFTVSPPPASRFAGDDGLSYYAVEVGSLAQDEARSWTVTYVKPDSLLTAGPRTTTAPAVSPQPAATTAVGSSSQQPPASAPTQTSGGSGTTVLIFLIAFVALVGVGAGAFWLGRRVQASRGQAEGPVGGEGIAFCKNCGAALRPGARYCHVCRAEVKDRDR